MYNGNGRAATNLIRIPLYGGTDGWTVSDSEGKAVAAEVVPTFIHETQLKQAANNIAANELRFLATVDPVGYRTYFAQKSTAARRRAPKAEVDSLPREAVATQSISNGVRNTDALTDKPRIFDCSRSSHCPSITTASCPL